MVQDPKKLNRLLKKATHEVDPSSAVHNELVESNDHLEAIKNAVTAPSGAKVTLELPEGVSVATLKGEQGAKGDKGEKGDQGIEGQPGKDGVDGKDGIDGIDGQDGENGLPGNDGKQGEKGDKGEPGKDGLNGKNAKPEDIVSLLKKSKSIDLSDLRNSEQVLSAIGKLKNIETDGFKFNGKKYKFSELMHGGGGSGSSITLETNGVVNGDQTLLNLIAGSNISLSDNGLGGVTITGAAGGVTSINADATAAQVLAVGTTGTDFAIANNGTGTHTFNLPTASASNRGALSSTDWTTFNNKGSGTVTTLSVVTANGISGSVANPTTTPAITLTLGAITPTSVNSVVISGSGTPTLAVTGTTTVSGANTGDQNLFSSVVVSGQTTVTANSTTTALTLVAGTGITLTTDNTAKSVTITAGGGSGITIGTTTITSGTNTRILYDNAGVVGEYTLTGTGTVAVMATSPTLVTPVIGVATGTSLALTSFISASPTPGTVGNVSTFGNLGGSTFTSPSATDSLFLVSSATTGGLRSLVVEASFTGSANASSTYQGINSAATTSAGSTGNLTATVSGGLRNRYLVVHNGSGTVTMAAAVAGVVNTAALGSITDSAVFHAESPAVGSGITNTTHSAFWARGGATTGTITTRYGLRIDTLTGGTTKYGVFVQTDQSSFGGNTGFGNTAPSALVHVGTAGSTLGVIKMGGNTSGTITINPAAAAGTWTLTLPITGGSAGQFLQTNGSGTTTWANGGLTWSEVTGTTQTAAVNNGYILNNAGLVTLTLPTTAAVGDVVAVVGKGAGGWRIAQSSGQQVHFGNQDTTSGATGRLDSVNQYDSIEVICTVANNEFTVRSSQGNITVT